MSDEFTSNMLLIAIVLIVAIVLSQIIRKLLSVYIVKYAKKLKTDPTNFSFIKNSVGFLIYSTAVLFIFYKIPYLRLLGKGIFAGAGVLALILGFTSQKAFANIISGVFILIFRPFKISDIIEFKDGQKGRVEDITLRHTIIKDYENRRIIIPNSVISEDTIINSDIHDNKIRKHIVISISYDSNVDKAIAIIQEEALKHPSSIDNRTKQEIKDNEPVVMVRVISLGDFSVDLKAYVWAIGNDNAYYMKCDLLKSIKQRFDKEGIEIPFPYRTVVYKKDLQNAEDNTK